MAANNSDDEIKYRPVKIKARQFDDEDECPISVQVDNVAAFPWIAQQPKQIGNAPRAQIGGEIGIADFVPKDGWMAWERNMYMSGRPHQTLHTIANHAINYELQPAIELPPPMPKLNTPPPEPPGTLPPYTQNPPLRQNPNAPNIPAANEQVPKLLSENDYRDLGVPPTGSDDPNTEQEQAPPAEASGPNAPPAPPQPDTSQGPAPEDTAAEPLDPELIARAQLAAEDCHYLQDISEQFNLEQCLKVATVYRDAFGYGAIYPSYDRIPDPNHPLNFYLGNLKKIRVLDSTQLQVIRDNVFDLRKLYTYFPQIPPKLEAMGKPALPNNTGRIVGFILTISSDTRTKLISAVGEEIKPEVWARLMPGMDEMSIDYTRVFYYDDELIIFFRDASAMFPDGVSLLRANYTMLENKLMLDRVAVTGYAKSVIPTWLVKLPQGMKQFRDEVHTALKQSRQNPGSDIIMMNHEGLDITRSIADGLQSAQPLLEYFEDQYNAAFGIFDTMSNSASANRATAEIQSDLFKRMIEPLRKDVERIITTRLFMPLLEKKHGLTPSSIMQTPSSVIAGTPDDPQQVPRQDVIPTGDKPYLLPKWKWGALIDSDKNELLAAFAPFMDAMSQDQIDFVLETYGGIPKRLGPPAGIIAKQKALEQMRMNVNMPQVTPPQTSEGGAPYPPYPQQQYGATVGKGGTSNPNPPRTSPVGYQSTGVGPQTAQGKGPSGKTVSQSEQEPDVRTVDERRKDKGLPALKKGGDIIPMRDDVVLYDPNAEES